MSGKRVVYQNWIFESSLAIQNDKAQTKLQKKIIEEVQKATTKLSEDEREFIKLFYNMGKSYREISELSGKRIFKLESIHNRATKKLRRHLSKFVRDQFEIIENNQSNDNNCPLCKSDRKEGINNLIQKRDKTKTWKPILKILREDYSINLRTVQTIIGHEKYHI